MVESFFILADNLLYASECFYFLYQPSQVYYISTWKCCDRERNIFLHNLVYGIETIAISIYIVNQ
jgi:hypothetical protein